MDCYYFGTKDRAGHYLFLGQQHFNHKYLPDDFPLNPNGLDGRLLPPMLPQEQGRAEIIYFIGWTIIAFWDRSVDSREGSNSAFIMRGNRTFNEALKIAKESYPHIWERFNFKVFLRR